ncbi:hypothetical protein CICLE_v10033325mg, partial [Citrus x clementina]
WLDLSYDQLRRVLPRSINISSNTFAGSHGSMDLGFNHFEGHEMSTLEDLDLSTNIRNGTIPPSMRKMRDLTFLDLSNNYLSEEIPSNADISYNHITGEIKELTNAFSACNVSTLETLDLASNKLGGNLPDSLGNLLCLEYLGLSENSFLGSLPTSIGNLSHLRALYLSFNVMSRIISENIGQLSEPYMLDLYGNSWEGIITEKHFRNLSGLDYLTISSSNSSLVFNIRHDWIAPFNLYTIRGGTRLLVQGLPKYVTSPNFS